MGTDSVPHVYQILVIFSEIIVLQRFSRERFCDIDPVFIHLGFDRLAEQILAEIKPVPKVQLLWWSFSPDD
jgi:hypothetical protein